MTAGMISADDAKSWGLVNEVVPQADLITSCEKMASKIARNSPRAISAAIVSVNAQFKEGVDGYKTEIAEFGKCFGTKDFVEGTTAFVEKRKAVFTGE